MDSVDGGGDNRGEQGGEKRDIRRPMNAFLIFCKRHRSMVREKHPDRDNRSVTRILGDLWANLAEDEKLVYTNLAKQYKDAFMKAHPDYKWHSAEKVSQPVKMATRPTNARPPRSLSTSDYPSEGGIIPGQLADPDKMGGLNLLLMAGQHSFPIRDKPVTSASIMERRMTAPDVSGANAALLQLAEMCSSELRSTQADDTALRSAPPKKRARHWSYSEFGHASSADWANRNAAFMWNLPPLPTPSVPCQPTQTQTASQVSATHIRPAESTFQRQEGEEEKKQQPTNNNAAYSLPIGSGASHIMPVNSSPPYTMPANSSAPYTMPTNSSTPFTVPANSSPLYTVPANNGTPYTLPARSDFSQQNQHDFTPVANPSAQKPCPGDAQTSAAISSELGIPPKKKFTKLQDACKSELPGAPSPNSAAGGCLSDQNDNAIFTCGKLVVDHIIDRLFSASFTPDQNISAQNLSADDIERARKILTADISEREKLQGSASRDMGRLLSEVVHKPQNLVEKVIEEAYSSIDLKQMKQMETLMPRAKHHSPLDSKAHHVKPAMQAEAVTSHLKPSSQLKTIASLMKQEAVEAACTRGLSQSSASKRISKNSPQLSRS